MIKGLELLHLCRRVTTVPLNRAVHTNSVLLMNRRRRGVQRSISEPGVRHRRAAFKGESDYTEETDDFLEEEVDVMNIDRAYDLNKSTRTKDKIKLQQIITAKKFFSSGPEPSTLTCNERECIRYLHKQDPVQWNVKTLSESFPATTESIKKVLKAKWKITPEKAKIIDSKVQKNWELLEQGKLKADPKVINHLKQFVNRREVLLEQIKNADFYLPQVKKEHVWNKGEFTGLLSKYEKIVERLLQEKDAEKQAKMLSDGTEKEERNEEKMNSVDFVHEKIRQVASRKELENKDSFLYGNVTKFYSKHKTLEEFEGQILKRADAGKKLDVFDKAILETKLDMKSYQSVKNLTATKSSDPVGIKEKPKQQYGDSDMIDKSFVSSHKKFSKKKFRERTEMLEEEKQFDYPPNDENTLHSDETGIGKLLSDLKKRSEAVEDKIVKEKSKIDFSDPERVARENTYYDNEVKQIEQTAFWNNKRSSHEKAMAEFQKLPHEGPENVERVYNPANTMTLRVDGYPERIKIPDDKKKSGLTFKVKDCYYDDDGQFLYRVPGMIK